jgi:hypothetical protein
MKCDICGKRMWFFQDLVMTTDELGEVSIPINHSKCMDKQNGKPYYPKEK